MEDPLNEDILSGDKSPAPIYTVEMLYQDRSALAQAEQQRAGVNHRAFAVIPGSAYLSSRAVTYANHEYFIHNLSRPDAAIWVWNREFSSYSGEWRNHETCYLGCTDWFFSDAAFSANAYSHFTPGFSATFQVPANKSGHSTFRFISAVHPVALAGHIRYQFLLQDYSHWSQKGEEHRIEQWFRVNWDAFAFSVMPAITLETANKDGTDALCLRVPENSTADGADVDVYRCRPRLNQYWHYDGEQRLQSLVAENRCLTAGANNTLSIRPCTSTGQQKWLWQAKRLMNPEAKYLTLKDNHLTLTTELTPAVSEWSPYLVPSSLDDVFTLEK